MTRFRDGFAAFAVIFVILFCAPGPTGQITAYTALIVALLYFGTDTIDDAPKRR